MSSYLPSRCLCHFKHEGLMTVNGGSNSYRDSPNSYYPPPPLREQRPFQSNSRCCFRQI